MRRPVARSQAGAEQLRADLVELRAAGSAHHLQHVRDGEVHVSAREEAGTRSAAWVARGE